VADKLKELAAADAKKAGTRESRLLRLDGFDFAFLDGTAEGDYSQHMLLRGAINGALYSVAVFARSDVTLTPELAQRLTSLHIDYASLLQMGSRLDEEGRLAIDGQRLTTPLGTLSLDKDIEARLIRSTRASGPDGRATFRRRTFALGKDQSFFSGAKYMHMSVGCGAMSEWNYDGYIRMADRPKDNGKPRPLKSLGPATLSGLDGRRSVALEELSAIRRVAAEKDGTHFEVEIEHLNASGLADDLAEQMIAPATCERELVFVPQRGAAPPEGTASKE
jgi:hypothetical protein